MSGTRRSAVVRVNAGKCAARSNPLLHAPGIHRRRATPRYPRGAVVQAAAAYGFSGSDGRRFIHLPHSS